MTPTVRFAPSPTGYLHIGNARPALVNWLFALQNGGRYILRYDDTDVERSRPEFAAAIARDLEWLGIRPDTVARQSDRADRHRAAQQRLAAAGLLYPCYETPEQLDRKRSLQAMRGLPPVYDRAALKLTAAEKAGLEAQGRRPHWRFLLPNHGGDPFAPVRTEVRWNDLVRGEEVVDLSSLSDPVLVREDGSWLYTHPSVVDDIDLGVTHVIRGEDHVTNTGVQIALFRALGAEPPAFAHVNLLTTPDGKLSKRLGSLSLHDLAADGYEPMAVASLAVLTGTAAAVEPCATMAELAAVFDLSDVGKSMARFDTAELDRLNARLVQKLEWVDVAARFPDCGLAGREAELWGAVRGNLGKVGDFADWARIVVAAEPVVDAADRAFLAEAATLLPDAPWDATVWRRWTEAIKARSERRGKALFMPLRKALTGLDHGPEMAALLPVIGPERTRARLP